MVISGPIDFLFGLPINLNVNAGQNKFEVDILKYASKIANFKAQNWPDTTFEGGGGVPTDINGSILKFCSDCHCH